MSQRAGKTMIFGIFVAALLGISCAPIFAQPKKDVSDPVLNEILTFFSHRMPRFINQHGQDVFVADDPVTRGGLISAMYEYDRSLKFAPKQDVAELKEKVASIEKTQNVYDIDKIILDLQPNMPAMLDKSLNNSKVFINLKNESAKKQVAEPQALGGKTITENLTELTKRMEKLESVPVSSHAAPTTELAELKNRLSVLEDKISAEKASAVSKRASEVSLENLSRRIEKLESASASKQKPVPETFLALSQRIEKLEHSGSITQPHAPDLSLLEQRIERLERAKPPSAREAEPSRDMAKKVDKIDYLTEQNKALEEKLARIEDRLNNLDSGGATAASPAQASTQDMADISKRLDKVEKIANAYNELERVMSKLDAHLSSVERVSSLGNISSSEELSELAKRVSELERVQKNSQNK